MDMASEIVGSNGNFQKILSILICLVDFSIALSSTGIPFFSKSPEFTCKSKKKEMSNFTECGSELYCLNDLYDYKKNTEKSLNNFAFTFDLYCENNIYLEIMSSSLFIGIILSTLFFSTIPDKYGRLNIYKIMCLGLAITNISLFFTTGPYHLILSFFLVGICSFLLTMKMPLICEFMSKQNSGLIMSLSNISTPLSGIIVTLHFMFINDWRNLILMNMLVSLIVAYFVFVYLVESPRWLNSQHKHKEMKESLMKIAVFNGNEDIFTKFLENNKWSLEKEESSSNIALNEQIKIVNIIDILFIPKFRYIFVSLLFCWWVIGACFWGLIFNLKNLNSSVFIDSIIIFGAEMVAESISGYFSDIFGRKYVMVISSIFGGICYIIYDYFETGILKTSLLLCSSLGISSIFNILFIYSPETFPITVRTSTNGMLFIASRLGAIMSPFMLIFFTKPPIIFGILAVVTGLVISTLEETLGKQLNENFYDNEIDNRGTHILNELIIIKTIS